RHEVGLRCNYVRRIIWSALESGSFGVSLFATPDVITASSPGGAAHGDHQRTSGVHPRASLVAAASARPDCDRIRSRELGPARHLARLAGAALWRLLARGWSAQRLGGPRGEA